MDKGFSDNKAGMVGLDKAHIQRVIAANTSSNFGTHSAKRQRRIDERVAQIRDLLKRCMPAQMQQLEVEADVLLASMEAQRDLSRVIVHIDMDAFFAAVEMRDNPALRVVPMAVGSDAMLATSNYVARRFGIRSGMPGFIARKLCADLTIVRGNYGKYRRVSDVVRRIFSRYDPNVHMGSLDEACLDITQLVANRFQPVTCKRIRYDGREDRCICRLPLLTDAEFEELARTTTAKSEISEKNSDETKDEGPSHVFVDSTLNSTKEVSSGVDEWQLIEDSNEQTEEHIVGRKSDVGPADKLEHIEPVVSRNSDVSPADKLEHIEPIVDWKSDVGPADKLEHIGLILGKKHIGRKGDVDSDDFSHHRDGIERLDWNESCLKVNQETNEENQQSDCYWATNETGEYTTIPTNQLNAADTTKAQWNENERGEPGKECAKSDSNHIVQTEPEKKLVERNTTETIGQKNESKNVNESESEKIHVISGNSSADRRALIRDSVCAKCGRVRRAFIDSLEFGTDVDDIVNEIRFQVHQETGLTCSAGISANWMLAKVCSDMRKPNGQFRVAHDRCAIIEFMRSLAVRKVPGVGPVTEALLANAFGIVTCGDLLEKRAALHASFSQSQFRYFMAIALGVRNGGGDDDGADDDGNGEDVCDRRSISIERTFAPQSAAAFLLGECGSLCDALLSDCASRGIVGGRTATVKIKFASFDVVTRARSVPQVIANAEAFRPVAIELLRNELSARSWPKVRLIGVRLSKLEFVDQKPSNEPMTTSKSNQRTLADFMRPSRRPIASLKKASNNVELVELLSDDDDDDDDDDENGGEEPSAARCLDGKATRDEDNGKNEAQQRFKLENEREELITVYESAKRSSMIPMGEEQNMEGDDLMPASETGNNETDDECEIIITTIASASNIRNDDADDLKNANNVDFDLVQESASSSSSSDDDDGDEIRVVSCSVRPSLTSVLVRSASYSSSGNGRAVGGGSSATTKKKRPTSPAKKRGENSSKRTKLATTNANATTTTVAMAEWCRPGSSKSAQQQQQTKQKPSASNNTLSRYFPIVI